MAKANKAMPKQPKRSTGRPKAAIDWNVVGEMLEAGCFATGISSSLGIDEKTLYNRCETDNEITFSIFRQQKLAKGNDLLRQAQFKSALGGNTAMQIWLGKQRLDQREKQEITGKDGGPVEITTRVIEPGDEQEQIDDGNAQTTGTDI